MQRRVALFAWIAAVATAGSGRAQEAPLQISPLRIDLGEHALSATLTLTNEGSAPRDIVITGYRWDEEPDAPQRLGSPTGIVIFPRSFSLGARERRIVRVGRLDEAGTIERAYRLAIVELPPADVFVPVQPGLDVRTRVSIPVFVSARVPKVALALAAIRLADGAFTFEIRNDGSTHAYVSQYRIDARDASGADLAATTVRGWYVLAGATQRYRGQLPAKFCKRVVAIRIVATAADGTRFESTATPQRACSSAV